MSEETAVVKLDFGKALSDAFGLLKGNLCLLIVSSLIATVLSSFCFLLLGAMLMGMFASPQRKDLRAKQLLSELH